ncbi:sensor histidine kinase [Zavarzinella formosa]|uniref:sensor histidine kinase n=1 Tax=Zavarzinella formosa TaxID=360055 RepID=UPI0002EAF35C|nr:HAMP domain-containing sensor histidine kinase [Zavarzinella formosa]
MWHRGKFRAFLSFGVISLLILGGLTWATLAAVRAERTHRDDQLTARRNEAHFQASKERADLMRQALWRLDARLAPALAREESRPYPHYIALHSPFPALTSKGVACVPGSVYLPSPLLTAELPEWMSLHFQIDSGNGWVSPQVVPADLQQLLRKQPIELALNNVTDERARLLETLKTRYPIETVLGRFRELGVTATESPSDVKRWAEMNELLQATRPARGNISRGGNSGNEKNNDKNPEANPIQQNLNFNNGLNITNNPNYFGNTATPQQLDYVNRMSVIDRARREGQWAYIFDDNRANGGLTQTFPGKTGISLQTVEVQLGQLRPVWLPNSDKPEHLILIRGATVSGRAVYQGILIDWSSLQGLILEEISDLFPEATFKAIPAGEPVHPDRTMTALPVEFEPNLPEFLADGGDDELPGGPSALRLGLGVAWGAAIIALLAIAIGGWLLLDLSDRRIRFVSAVTHELRTPMTTLRLYLDLLSSGMVTEEKQKAEYLTTLNAESDRLHRLIVNVLDFARLEKSRPQVSRREMFVADLVAQMERNWAERCVAAGKQLVIVNHVPSDACLKTDAQLLEQIIGNLIDNAQKYSRDASDPRIILRTELAEKFVHFDVEDRGPGVGKRHRRSVFRPFRRGEDTDHKAGGVGLGLALATRWASLIGGRLSLQAAEGGVGACFRVSVPRF